MRIASAILFLAAASGDALAASGGGAIRAIAVEGNDIWAVGDAGALIHSPDGGTTWQEPNAPTAANFQAVRVQGHTVFVFGGSALAGHPDGAGVGTIARSDDDGKSFLPISTGDAGWLYGGFYAGSTAVVFGQATPNARGGIWRSVAEGRWHPLAGETAGHLLGGVFPRRDLGYVVGVNQRILSVRDLEQSRHHPPPDASPFTLRAAALETQEPHRCWCVGEEGLVLRSPPGLAVT